MQTGKGANALEQRPGLRAALRGPPAGREVSMHFAHPFGIAGLILNTASAIGLLKFSANPDANSPLTHEQLQSLRSASPELRRPYLRQLLAYRLSLGALALGFFLQFLDLLLM